jgi:hypothetical protein
MQQYLNLYIHEILLQYLLHLEDQLLDLAKLLDLFRLLFLQLVVLQRLVVLPVN